MLLEVRALWVRMNKYNQSTFSKQKKKKKWKKIPNSCLFFSESLVEIQANIPGAAELFPFWTAGGSGTHGLSQLGKIQLRQSPGGVGMLCSVCTAPWAAPEELQPCLGDGSTLRKLKAHCASWAEPCFQLSLPDLCPKSPWGHFLFSVSVGGFGLKFFRVDSAKGITKCPISQVHISECVHHLPSNPSFLLSLLSQHTSALTCSKIWPGMELSALFIYSLTGLLALQRSCLFPLIILAHVGY